MGRMDADGFSALIRQAQAADREAHDNLYRRVQPFLDRLARVYADPARASESASDLAQEAWLRAWQYLDRFKCPADDGESAALFRTWLAQVVRRVGLNKRRDGRAKKRRPPQPLLSWSADDSVNPGPTDPQPSPSANARLDERDRLVLQALADLPDEIDRTLVRLRFFDGLSLREITDRVGLTYDQVRLRYQQALRQLGSRLGKLE
jgi:RNA polymerase sigma factor (sigma-70 family)